MQKRTPEELALDILTEGKFDTLPIKISHLAKVNRVEHMNRFDREKFQNCVEICQFILQSENMDADLQHAQQLAVLVMAPPCVLKDCKVSSAESLHVLTALPIKIAEEIYQNPDFFAANGALAQKERQVAGQFRSFIDRQISNKPHFHRP